MYELIIFDKDGTLVKTKTGQPYPKWGDQVVLDEALVKKLYELRAKGTRLAIASNQMGVQYNFKTLGDVLLEINEAFQLCSNLGDTPFDLGAYFCPDEGNVLYRVINKSDWTTFEKAIALTKNTKKGILDKVGNHLIEGVFPACVFKYGNVFQHQQTLMSEALVTYTF